MKPGDAEKGPRRDGRWERTGKWGEIVVGAIIKGRSGRVNDLWEVTELSMGNAPIPAGYMPWVRAQSVETLQFAAMPPRPKGDSVVFIVDERDSRRPLPPPTEPTDADKVMLLIEELGATILAEKDSETGVVTCPNYAEGEHNTDDWRWGREFLEHLRVFHKIDAEGMSLRDRAKIHGQAHHSTHPRSREGVPHQHNSRLDHLFI